MSRLAYIWVILSVGFAFWFHAHEEAQRRAEIKSATIGGLSAGVRYGCKANNHIRRQMEHLADQLHPTVHVHVRFENCDRRVSDVIWEFVLHQR